MLSYRHAFHAGNHADVLKHIVLVLALKYLCQKDKPFHYVDTHAGAGQYDLTSEYARQGQEHLTGIARLLGEQDYPPELQSYLSLVEALNPGKNLQRYPGSPSLASAILRPQDRANVYDLHSTEFATLYGLLKRDKRFTVQHGDGLQALNALLPPLERRGLIMIDPAYEVKSDYQQVVKAIKEAHRKFATGVYLLWYPVLSRYQVNALERGLCNTGIPNILQVELAVRVDCPGRGMTGSGLFVVNPPWNLSAQLAAIMPFLQRQLCEADGFYRLLMLVTE